MRSRVEKALFAALVLFVYAGPIARATVVAGELARIHNCCGRSPMSYSDDVPGVSGGPVPVLGKTVQSAPRRTAAADVPLTPEEVPIPSAVWLAAIGFGCAGSVLRRKPE